MSDQSEADQRVAKIQKIQCMQRCCIVSSFACISAFLLGFVASRNWSLDSEGVPYLNSYGIGGATWGFLTGLVGLRFWLYVPPKPHAMPDGTSDYDLNSVFKDGIGIIRTLKVLVLLGRIAVNAAFISYNWQTLPPRNPDERLNLAKYVVTWVEFPVLCLLGASALLSLAFLAATTGTSRGEWTASLKDVLHQISSWSVLQSLRRANPMTALEEMKKAHSMNIGKFAVLLKVPFLLFIVTVAIMSLIVKISQIDFVTEESYTTWRIEEWARLFAFVNNVASITPPPEVAAIDAVLVYVGNGDPHFPRQWKQVLGKGLVDTFGKLNGLVFILTLTRLDVQKCLNPKNFDGEVVSSSAITAPNVVLGSEIPNEPGA